MSREIRNEHLKTLNEVFGDALAKNHFSVIGDLRELFSPKRDQHGRWYRISCTGELNLCDYNAGLVSVSLSVQADRYDQALNKFFDYVVFLSVGTLDDGSWAAWSKTYEDVNEATAMMNKIGEELLPDLVVLPTDEKLNEMLRPYGLFGEYQG